MKSVILWRHGRTAWNAERRFQGQADPPLDGTGRDQADAAAALLASLRPEYIVTSDLRRAAQTAAALGRVTGVGVVIDPRLRERSLGHWEGLTRDEVEERYPDEMADWVAGRDVSRRGGESREQVAARACEAFDTLPDTGVAVIVTHSATAMALTTALLGLPQTVHLLGPLANCHWSELYREPAGWRLRAHNAGPQGSVIPLPFTPDAEPDAEAIDADVPGGGVSVDSGISSTA
ncbi:MAG: histidine phosphatase family protein [Jatrophihabitans sp.]